MINKTYMLICAWVGILVVGLGTAAPALVSAGNSLAAVGGVIVAAASIFALVRVSNMILVELEKNNG